MSAVNLKKNKAVVLGTNYYIGLSIIRCLGKEKVWVVACDYDFQSSYGAKSKYISEFLKIDGLNLIDENVLSKLIDYGKKQQEKPVLIPSHDKYVEFIDKYYEELSEVFLISQRKGLNSKLVDKWKLYDIALENGVKMPKSIDIDDENIYEVIENEIKYPCIIKPVDTVVFTQLFRRKIFMCETREDVFENIKKCKDNNIKAFVQQVIPGFDDHMMTYDSYIDKTGETTHYMTAQKQRQWPINFGASVFTKQKCIEELVEIGKPFMESIGYRGFSEIEFKKHQETGEVYVIEINVRITNFNSLINKVGINVPYITYCDLTGVKFPEKKYIKNDTGYSFIYGFEDILSILKYSKAGQKSIWQSLKISFSSRWAMAIFQINDLKPWLYFNYTLFEKVVKKIFGGKRG